MYKNRILIKKIRFFVHVYINILHKFLHKYLIIKKNTSKQRFLILFKISEISIIPVYIIIMVFINVNTNKYKQFQI